MNKPMNLAGATSWEPSPNNLEPFWMGFTPNRAFKKRPRMIARAKDMHYRRALGEPIPMLGNRSPRQCRRSKLGRALLVDWLKEIENRELRDAARGGTAPYDMSWMWQELGIDRER